MKDKMEVESLDLPWDEDSPCAVESSFEETDECLLLRAKAIARAEMLARMVSVSTGADEGFGPN